MTELAPTLADRLRAIVPPALRYPKYRAYWCRYARVGVRLSDAHVRAGLADVPAYGLCIATARWFGIVSLASASTSIALNLFGGVFADRLDKQKLIFFCQLATASLIFLLGLLTFFEVVKVWHIVSYSRFCPARSTPSINRRDRRCTPN